MDYLKTEDVESFVQEPNAKKMLREMLPKKEARFFVSKVLKAYPNFLAPPTPKKVEVESHEED